MIDTDKYEGHTKEEWQFDGEMVFYHRNGNDVEITQPIVRGDCDDGYYEDAANAFLIADAPLLLAEVKRLREKNEKLHSRCMHLENLLEEWQGAYE